MKKFIMLFIIAGLPFSAANAEDQAGKWLKVTDDSVIEKFLQTDKTWADTMMQAMGTSGSGGVTGLQMYLMGGSGSGGVTGTILSGIYEINNNDDFQFFSKKGITPSKLKANEFYKLKNFSGREQIGYFSGSEWVVSE